MPRTFDMTSRNFARDLSAQLKDSKKFLMRGLSKAAKDGLLIVEGLTPEDLGLLKEAWEYTDQIKSVLSSTSPTVDVATLENDAPYATAVENIRGPYFVNREGRIRIREWARRKFSIDEEQAERLSHAIATNISRDGGGKRNRGFVRNNLSIIAKPVLPRAREALIEWRNKNR